MCRIDYLVTTTTTTTKQSLPYFQNGLHVIAGVGYQNHSQIFCVFEELLHLLTLSKVQTDHNGPQVNPAMSAFPLNNNNNKLINEAGSLCSSDSLDEENEIEEQSGRPIQCQIPQSQWGTVKTVLVENNLSTASFRFRFFIQLSSQPVHMSCDFPFVYRKLH